MTVEEAKTQKRELERQLYLLISRFENQTELQVSNVFVTRQESGNGKSAFLKVQTVVEVK